MPKITRCEDTRGNTSWKGNEFGQNSDTTRTHQWTEYISIMRGILPRFTGEDSSVQVYEKWITVDVLWHQWPGQGGNKELELFNMFQKENSINTTTLRSKSSILTSNFKKYTHRWGLECKCLWFQRPAQLLKCDQNRTWTYTFFFYSSLAV